MKNQKAILKSQSVNDPKNFEGHAGEDVGGSFEPVLIEQMDEISALIVDFGESNVTTKTLLDLDEAALVTKSVEPFFLDALNGNLYSWEGPMR